MVDFKKLAERAKKEGRTKNLTPDFMKWEKEGQVIIGEMVNKASVSSGLSEGSYMQYLFETEDGLKKFSLGKAADGELDNVMVPGGYYEITYKGQEQISGGRKVNKFAVICFGSRDEFIPEEPEDTSSKK